MTPNYSRSNLAPQTRAKANPERPASYDTERDLVEMVTAPLQARLFTADEDRTRRMNIDWDHANDN